MFKTIEQQFDEHIRTVQAGRSAADVIRKIADLLITTFRNGRKLYLLGNGGSAADAQHIAAEFIGRFKNSKKSPLPAIALTTDTSNLTAVGNDYGFENIYRRQVEALVQAGDVLWALSVSGSSSNIIKAVETARQKKAIIIGFTGKEGFALKKLSDTCLMSDHMESDRVQEFHQLAYHIICGLVEEAFV